MSEEIIVNEMPERTLTKFETMYSPKYKKEGIDIGNPKLKKYGQELDVREWINENNVDCEIYETLEKYGTVKQRQADLPQIVGEMEQLDLRKFLDRQIATENLWKSLPLDVRKEFKNNENEFMEKGIEWMNNKIEELKPKEPTPQEPQPKQETTGE